MAASYEKVICYHVPQSDINTANADGLCHFQSLVTSADTSQAVSSQFPAAEARV